MEFRRVLFRSDEDTAALFHDRATSIGIYHVRYWAGTFAFLDAVATDTPIFQEETRAGVSKIAASFDLGDRFTRTSLFRTYLESQWHVANFAANYFDFAELLRSQHHTFQAAESVIARPQASRR